MNGLKKELTKKFGMDGNGLMEKSVSVKEFEIWSGATLDRRSSNEYDSEDCTITLISAPDDGSDELEITLEIENEVITHCYY